MCQLLETIKIDNGRFYNLSYHADRMNRSRRDIFNITETIPLDVVLIIPAWLGYERYRCRVVYDQMIRSIEYLSYTIQFPLSLKLVNGSSIEYAYKYADRSIFAELKSTCAEDQEILIVKDGRITDTSYSNVALWDGDRWYTPATVLLKGTKRQQLLDSGKILERDIRSDDIAQFQKISLINAMLDIGEVEINTSEVRR